MLVREDLPTGLQMAQVAHACIKFALDHPDRASSTPIGVVLGVPGKHELIACAEDLEGTAYVLFEEEDLGGEVTALATVSDGRYFSSLPLAHREPAMVP